MTDCSTCGNQSWLCQQCKMDELEDRYETATDPDHWILEDGLWHASTDCDGSQHICVCGAIADIPVTRVTQDLRYVPEKYDAPVCRECAAALEGSRAKTVPDDAQFERASELCADGGISETERLDRAVREAATLIDAGDSERAAIGTAASAHCVEHRRDDLCGRVRDRLGRHVMTDGGHDPEDLVVLECPDCDYQTVVGRGAVPATSCPYCEDGLEIDPDRTAHRCPESYADHVIVPAGDECQLCGEVRERPVATDGGQSVDETVRSLRCHQFTSLRLWPLNFSDPSQRTKTSPAPPEQNNAPAKLTTNRGISIAKATTATTAKITDIGLGTGEVSKNTEGGGTFGRFVRDGGGHSLHTDTGRDIRTDGGKPDYSEIREEVPFFVRRSNSGGAKAALHLPAEDATREDPTVQCRYNNRDGVSFRVQDLDATPDWQLENRGCSECFGTANAPSNTECGRKPSDVLEEAGFDIATDGGHDLGGRRAFLAGDAHWCDLCDQPFDSLTELIHHDCDDTQIAIADGGRPQHRATCEDCPWTYSDPDLLEVSDEAEDHARKEMHDVDLQRAVATDGGQEAAAYMTEEVELRIRGDRVHVQALLAVLSVASEQLSGGTLAPAADLAGSVPEQAMTLEDTIDTAHSMIASEGDGWDDADPTEALDVEFVSVVDDQDDRDIMTDGGVDRVAEAHESPEEADPGVYTTESEDSCTITVVPERPAYSDENPQDVVGQRRLNDGWDTDDRDELEPESENSSRTGGGEQA